MTPAEARVRLLFSFFTLASCVLIGLPTAGAAADKHPLGNLNWGLIPHGDQCLLHIEDSTDLQRRIRQRRKGDDVADLGENLLRRAKSELNDPLPAVKFLEVSEHPFLADKEYQAQSQASRNIQKLLHISLCARLAEGGLADRCRERSTAAINDWISTYKPSGQPIDENALLPLLESIDLMSPLMPQSAPSRLLWKIEKRNLWLSS